MEGQEVLKEDETVGSSELCLGSNTTKRSTSIESQEYLSPRQAFQAVANLEQGVLGPG